MYYWVHQFPVNSWLYKLYEDLYSPWCVILKDFATLKHWPQAKTFWVWRSWCFESQPSLLWSHIKRENYLHFTKLTSKKVSVLRLGKYFLISPSPLIHLQRSSLFFRRPRRDFSGMIKLSDLRELYKEPRICRVRAVYSAEKQFLGRYTVTCTLKQLTVERSFFSD